MKRLDISLKPLGSYPLPNPLHVFLYNRGELKHCGPGSRTLQVDWFCKGITPWTMECAMILARGFATDMNREQSQEYESLKTLSLLEILKIFVLFIVHFKKAYARLPGVPETDEGL